MQKFTRLMILCLIITLSTFLVLGCAEKKTEDSGKKEISFWTIQLSPTYDDYINGVIAGFEAEHPDVKIKWTDVPHMALQQKLLNAMAAGTPPDVVNLNIDSFQMYAEKDALLDLDKYTTQEERGRYFQNVWEDNKYKGVSYGIPWYLSTGVLLINKPLYEAAGLSLDNPPKNIFEMMEYAKIIKEKTGKFGFMVTLAESGAFASLLLGEGLPLLDWETREPLFNTPEAVEYLQFWVENYQNGIIPKESIIEEHRKTIEMYSSGKTVMYNTGPQFLVQIKKNSPDVYANSVAFPPATGSANTIGIAVMNLVVFKKSQHPDLAVDFALHVTNAKNQLDFCKLAVIFPSVEETTKDPFFTSGTDLEADTRRIGAEQLPRAVNLKHGFKGSEVLNQLFDDAVQKACRGDLTSAEAIQEVEDKWREYLAKEK